MESLDVEDDEQRQRRILNHLKKLNTFSSAKIPNLPLKFDFGDRTTYSVAPPTELLARVQAFLPQIEASNAILTQQVETDPKSVDMEHVNDNMEHYIEMNLGLGVFEDRNTNGNDAGMTPGSCSDSASTDDRDSDDYDGSDTSSDTESSSEIITSFSPISRLIRPLPKRSPASRINKPYIQVVNEKLDDSGQCS